MEAMQNARWSGNVRELKNTLLYMMTVAEHNRLTINELPRNDDNFQDNGETRNAHIHPEITMSKSEEYVSILSVLLSFY
ncbi:hypothetical protein R0J91_19075, partial [Micrococcus sp. SIMBA_131]